MSGGPSPPSRCRRHSANSSSRRAMYPASPKAGMARLELERGDVRRMRVDVVFVRAGLGLDLVHRHPRLRRLMKSEALLIIIISPRVNAQPGRRHGQLWHACRLPGQTAATELVRPLGLHRIGRNSSFVASHRLHSASARHATVSPERPPGRHPGAEDSRHEGIRHWEYPQRRCRRTRRRGQDPVDRRPALHRWSDAPPGACRRWDDGHRLRRRRNRPEAHAVGQPRLGRVEQDQDQFHRHAGHGQLPVRCAGRPARRRRGAGRRRCRRRRRGADREGLGRSRCAGAAAPGGGQSARSRSREPRAHARPRCARPEPHRHPGAVAARRGAGFTRRRRPDWHEGVDICHRRQRQGDGRAGAVRD